MAVRARFLTEEANSLEPTDFLLVDLEERAFVDVLDEDREMEFFAVPACPFRVRAERFDVDLLPMILDDRAPDVDRSVLEEEKLFPTFRIFDRARTLEAFWLVKVFLWTVPLILGLLDASEIFPRRFVWLRDRATLEIRGA
jgi:hypothetical protein